MASFMPGESNGIPIGLGFGGGNGLGLLANPALQIGLGILANNNSRNLGQVLGRGAMAGIGNLQQMQQFNLQQNLMQEQLRRQQQQNAQEQARMEAMPRLLQGRSAYTTDTQVPVTTTTNVPIPPQSDAQAPNYGLQKQTETTMQSQPTFNNDAYMKDIVAAGFGDELIKQQFAPKKIGYRDVGDKLIPYDEATGAPRTDLEPISKGLTPDAQANVLMRNFEFNNLSAAQRASNALTQRGQNITLRGQNLTDARAREANSATNPAKAPNGYRWSVDGMSLEPIPGGPASKQASASEGERKAATLLTRLEGSLGQLNNVVSRNPSVAKPELLGAGLGAISDTLGNTIKSSDRQRVEAAQLDILDAALTLGTGAAYTKEQLQGYRQSYFPQIGDSAATIADKQQRLGNVIEAARIAAGRAAPQVDRMQMIPQGAAGGTINNPQGWSAREVR